MQASHFFLAATLTLSLSLLLPFLIRPVLIKLRVVDIPNERSSHDSTVVRGLGLAVLLALIGGGSYSTIVMFREGEFPHVWFLFTVGVFSLFSGLLGFGEDLRGVSVKTRSLLLLLISSAAAGALVYLGSQNANGIEEALLKERTYSHPDNLLFSDFPVWLLVLIAIYGVMFISGYINVANFMDGLNGISGLHGLIAGATFAILGWLYALDWLVFAGLCLGLAFAGFLPWNLSKNRSFLGDVGSYLLGGSVAILSFAMLAAGVPLLSTIGPMVIYFGDVAVTLVRRVRAGYRWDEPHKEHTYQRLQQQGRSHLQASLIVTAFSAITAAFGIVSVFFDGVGWILCLVGGVATLVAYLALPKLRK